MSTFWSSNTIEPKRSYQWVGYMNLSSPTGNSYDPAPFLIKSFTKPTFTLDSEKLINNFTSETEIITKNYVWEDISITMYDISNKELNVSNSIYSWLQDLGYQPIQSTNTLSKLITNLYDNKLSLTLEHIDTRGKPLERWSFVSPQPTKIDFGGELDYNSSEIMTVTMGVTYIAAFYEEISISLGALGDLI